MKLYTDLAGHIREVSEQSCELLNIASVRSALNRKLPLYFVENRHRVVEMMDAARRGFSKQVLTAVQNGRTRLRVIVEAHRIRSGHQELLEWIVRRID
jgi:hypothetical protein